MQLRSKKTNLLFFTLLFLSSFDLRADYLCKDFLFSSQLDFPEGRLSESVKRLIQIRFGNINMTDVRSYGVVSLPADLDVFERMGASFIVVINELEFEDGESLKAFLDILYDKVRDPGLIIIEKIPQGLKETFASVFGSKVNNENALFSMYFNPMSDVVIDVISSGDYYPPEIVPFQREPKDEGREPKDEGVEPSAKQESPDNSDQSAREDFAASDITEFEWANLRMVAASDQKAFDFITSYVEENVSEGQKFIITDVPRSVAIRIIEVIKGYSSRARRNPSLLPYASVESFPSLDQPGKNLVENRSSLFLIEITKVR